MQKQHITAVIAACVFGISSLSAVAQPRQPDAQQRGPQQGPQKPGPQNQGGHQQGPQHKGPQHQGAGPDRKGPQMQPQQSGHPHGMPPGQAKRMGAGPNQNWVQGGRVPAQYRTQHYVVNDWKRHGLKQPPRGQQWVQYGSDYVLVAVATGVIMQLILGR